MASRFSFHILLLASFMFCEISFAEFCPLKPINILQAMISDESLLKRNAISIRDNLGSPDFSYDSVGAAIAGSALGNASATQAIEFARAVRSHLPNSKDEEIAGAIWGGLQRGGLENPDTLKKTLSKIQEIHSALEYNFGPASRGGTMAGALIKNLDVKTATDFAIEVQSHLPNSYDQEIAGAIWGGLQRGGLENPGILKDTLSRIQEIHDGLYYVSKQIPASVGGTIAGALIGNVSANEAIHFANEVRSNLLNSYDKEIGSAIRSGLQNHRSIKDTYTAANAVRNDFHYNFKPASMGGIISATLRSP